MADKHIGALPAAPQVDDDSLLAVEQQGVAMRMTGAQFRAFAENSASAYAQTAKEEAESAAASAQSAAGSASAASGSAETAKQYSGNPPKPISGTWWVWDADTQEYEDTGEAARGNVMYATFFLDPLTGILTMMTPDEYAGPVFSLRDGYLEVSIANG